MRVGRARAHLGAMLGVVCGCAALAGCGGSSGSSASSSASEAGGSASSAASSAGSSVEAAAPSVASEASTVADPSASLGGFKLADYITKHVQDGTKLKFVYITNDLSSSYTQSQRNGVTKAKSQLGVDAELQGPPSGAAQDQVALIQTLISQKKVDGIVVAAVNVDSLKPVIDQAWREGIPLISAFTDQPNSKQLAFVGEDNEKFGQFEGKKLAASLTGKKGTVVVISVDTAAGWSTARVAGLKSGLASATDLKVVGPINTGVEPGQMYNAIQNAMQANPDAVAIASVDCCSITGAAKWVQTAQKKGKVSVIGTDALKSTLEGIKDGTITFSISQDPIGQVFTAISQLKDLVTKGTPPKTVLMPPLLITKANVSGYVPEG